MPAKLQQALALHQAGRLGEANRLYAEILKTHPSHFEALHFSGVAAFQLRNPGLAVELIGKSLQLNPNNAPAHINLGNALTELGRLDEALASYDRAIAIKPDLAEAHNNRGNTLKNLRRLDEALASCERAIAIRPDYAEAFNNRGTVLKELGHLDDALASYDRAIAMKPEFVEAYSNRGNALKDLRRLNEALASYERAIALRPNFAEAYNHRGVVLNDLKRLDEAVASYERAIEIKPDHADAHWNLAICRLLSGDFARGWQGFEWRWKTAWLGQARRDFAQPLWLGAASLEDKTILLHSEQGLGDTLQFCRYVSLVRGLGARVILEVPRPLELLLTTLDGVAQVVARGDALPEFDCQCPLLSLPLAFKTDLGSLPAGVPYIRSDAARVTAWQNKLGAKTRLRIGLAWSGSVTHTNDRNRSIALSDLLPLLGQDVEWVSLQKEVREGDAGLLASRPDIRHFGDAIRDFADTAALVELLDLVVSVDTSVAHLAGAMGKAVWILLPFVPDWRWLLDRDDSPWYPTARLFRQSARDDWGSVIGAVREELLHRVRDNVKRMVTFV